MKSYLYLFFTLIMGIGLSYSQAQAQPTAQTHHPETFLNSIQGKPDEGAQIVSHFCATCHDLKPMVNLGAPRIGISSDWLPRLKQGFEVMLQHTAEGYHTMPPRGGCFECDDDQLRKAILAMLPREESINKSKENK